jgi:hypothetical protein
VIAHGYFRATKDPISWSRTPWRDRHHARWPAASRLRDGFKRLANRPGDRVDLERLEQVNGELPIDPIPGLDED